METNAVTGNKFIIGLTGNIATGKSAVMQMAARQGAFTIDADRVVHHILNNDEAVQQAIVDAFGSAIRLEDGRIDRPALGQVVFRDPQALKRLESIVHPAVYHAVINKLADIKESVVMYEAIKLLESKIRSHCDQIWVTTCTAQKQLERLMQYRGMDEETAQARINAQPAQSEKIAVADVVIDTNGSMSETEAQFQQAWSALKIGKPFVN